MSYYGMNSMSGTNAPRPTTQAAEELKKEQQEQEIVDKELQRKADRREKIWKVLFQAFLVFVPFVSITVGIYWEDIVDYLKYKPIYEDESEWYYEEPENNEEEALVSVDSVSADEQAEVESVTSPTPATPATKSGSTSHWPNYSYSDLHRYDDDDDDDDDTWYRGDDDPDEYWEYDYHE